MNFPITILMQQDHPTIRIQEDPEVIFVQYRCKSGSDGAAGADGVSPDITDPGVIQGIIDALAGEITATELHQDLMTRINKIDLGANSLEAQAALLQYGLDQINQSFGVVSGRLADAEGAITAHDGQITAFGVDLATLDGTAQGHASLIESLDTRVTVTESDIESQATSITGLGSRVSAAEGSIVGQAAIINSLSTDVSYVEGQMTSLATSVSTIQSSVNNNTAAIQQEAITRANQTGDLYAKYSVKVDVNGKISGFGLQSTNTASLFEIVADRFAVVNSSGTGTQFPFIIDGGVVYISSAMIANAAITNAKIGAAAVDTLQVAGNAITAPGAWISYTSGSTTGSVTMLTGTLYAPAVAIGQSILVTFSGMGYGNPSGHLYFTAGETAIGNALGNTGGLLLTYVQSILVPVTYAGNYTFTVSGSALTYGMCSIFAILCKR